MIECRNCYDGIIYERGKKRICQDCDGEGWTPADELKRRRDAFEPTHKPSRPTAKELTSRFLNERGISARPTVGEHHLLPHERGEAPKDSEELRELEALKGQLGQDGFRLYCQGKLSEEDVGDVIEARRRAGLIPVAVSS